MNEGKLDWTTDNSDDQPAAITSILETAGAAAAEHDKTGHVPCAVASTKHGQGDHDSSCATSMT